MIVSVILLIFSFLFDGFISNYISSNFSSFNLFSTLYTLITLVVLYPYFHNEKKYYILLIVFGLLIDIVYTNTFILNVVIFIIISFMVKFLNFVLPENILMANVMTLCSIIIYHVLSFTILTIINYGTYTLSLLLDICLNSIIMTIIYTLVQYFLIKYLFNKFDIKQIK